MADPAKPKPKPPSLARAIGQFFGHVKHGFASPPVMPDQPPASVSFHPLPPERHVVAEQVREVIQETSSGSILLRRRVVDEVEYFAPPVKGSPPIQPVSGIDS